MAQALGITLDQGFNLRNSQILFNECFVACARASLLIRDIYVYGETDAQTAQAKLHLRCAVLDISMLLNC